MTEQQPLHTAVIMAAGLGSRFGKMTETMPKGFIPCGGQAMVERSISTLVACGIRRIVIGTGYKHEAYEALAKRINDCEVEILNSKLTTRNCEATTPHSKLQTQNCKIECVYSPRYAETNSMYTLWNCREAIGNDDFLLLESDIIFSSNAITGLIDDPRPDLMLITPVTKFQDQYYVESDEEGRLTRCSTDKTAINAKGELVGIHKLSAPFYRRLCEEYARIAEQQPKLGYEYQLLYMSQHVMPFFVRNDKSVHWYEIDDEQDLRYAEAHVVPLL